LTNIYQVQIFKQVMVNNSTNTNLNQTNNDLSSQLIEHNKRPEMVLEIQVLVWDKHKNVVGLNWL
jgi:hypothetical protein